MAEQNRRKLYWLEQNLPEGLLVTAAWLTKHGYSTSLRTQYVAAGWLEQPARGVFRRTRGELRWEQVVISLQTLLEFPLVIGGRTALELQGYAHFLSRELKEIHLYGHRPPPSWLYKLPLPERFVFHRSTRLFRNTALPDRPPAPSGDTAMPVSTGAQEVGGALLLAGLSSQPWGQWDWPLALSTPERATFELLDELPDKESFHQVDKLAEGLANLSPRRLQALLEDCKSIKAKRLFFFFADRYDHAWLKRIDRSRVDLGKGKRMLVRGGRLDQAYGITVPEDLDGVQ